MLITRFETRFHTVPEHADLDVPALCAALTSPLPDDRPKDRYPLWSPATYPPGTRRNKRNVLDVTSLVADVDDGTPIDTALARLRGVTPALAIIHTSYSHTPAHPKYRLVVPLEHAVPAGLFPRAWVWFAGVLGCLDPAVKDASRMYYVPVQRPNFAAAVDDGPLLDMPWDDLPPAITRTPLRPPDGAPPGWTPRPTDYPPDTITRAVTELRGRAALAAASTEPLTGGRRTAIRNALYPLARYGWLDPALPNELREIFARAAAVNGRVGDNMDRLLDSCVLDAATDPGPIEDLVPADQGVAAPLVVACGHDVYVLRQDGAYESTDRVNLITGLRDRHDVPYRSDKGTPWTYSAILDRYGVTARGVEVVYPVRAAAVPKTHRAKPGDETSFSPGALPGPRHVTVVTHPQAGSDPRLAWDGTSRVLTVCRATRTDPAPQHDPEVADWLARGLDHNPPAVVDAVLRWLAVAGDVESPVAALYVHGPRRAGKGLLVAALASPWHAAPVPLATALGPWTADLARCPIVHLDEGARADEISTERFRSLVSERVHQLSEKFRGNVTLRGCPRVVITANNDGALRFGDVPSLADVDAVAERVLYVRWDVAAAEYLAALGGAEYTVAQGWVHAADGGPGRVARHLATLARGAPDARLLVEGVPTEYHRALVWRSPRIEALLDVLVAALTAHGGTPGVVWAGADVSADLTALLSRWPSLALGGRRPGRGDTASALTAISRSREGGVWLVDGATVRSYAASVGVTTHDTLGSQPQGTQTHTETA